MYCVHGRSFKCVTLLLLYLKNLQVHVDAASTSMELGGSRM